MHVRQFARAMLGGVRLCAIHNSFVLYDGGVFPACRPSGAGCQ